MDVPIHNDILRPSIHLHVSSSALCLTGCDRSIELWAVSCVITVIILIIGAGEVQSRSCHHSFMGPEWCHGTHRWSHTHKYKYWIIYMEPQVMFMNRNNGDKQSRDTMDCDTARVSWWSELLLWYFSFRWPTATTNIHCGKYSSQQTDQQNTNIIQITFTSDSVMIFSISRRMMKMRRWFQEAWQRSGLSSVPAGSVQQLGVFIMIIKLVFGLWEITIVEFMIWKSQ